MTKTIIAVLVGSIIMFAYQAISWTVSPIHKNSYRYTPMQDSILQSMKGLEEGMYAMPILPAGRSMSEHQEFMKANIGKPAAYINYQSALANDMGKLMGTGFILNLVAIWLFVWLVRKGNFNSMGSILTASLVMGLILAFNARLMDWNWFKQPMHFVSGELIDSLLMWFLTGLWLGWYLSRKQKSAKA